MAGLSKIALLAATRSAVEGREITEEDVIRDACTDATSKSAVADRLSIFPTSLEQSLRKNRLRIRRKTVLVVERVTQHD